MRCATVIGLARSLRRQNPSRMPGAPSSDRPAACTKISEPGGSTRNLTVTLSDIYRSSTQLEVVLELQ
eukprot:244599-Hanusia_phi.AAC.1